MSVASISGGLQDMTNLVQSGNYIKGEKYMITKHWNRLAIQLGHWNSGQVIVIDATTFMLMTQGVRDGLANEMARKIGRDAIWVRDYANDQVWVLGPKATISPDISFVNGVQIWDPHHFFAPKPAAKEKIARPPNAFIIYRSEKAKALKSENQELHNNEISVLVGEMWRAETLEVRQAFQKKSELLKAAILKNHPDYRYNPRRPSQIRRRNRQGVTAVSPIVMDANTRAQDFLPPHQPSGWSPVSDPTKNNNNNSDPIPAGLQIPIMPILANGNQMAGPVMVNATAHIPGGILHPDVDPVNFPEGVGIEDLLFDDGNAFDDHPIFAAHLNQTRVYLRNLSNNGGHSETDIADEDDDIQALMAANSSGPNGKLLTLFLSPHPLSFSLPSFSSPSFFFLALFLSPHSLSFSSPSFFLLALFLSPYPLPFSYPLPPFSYLLPTHCITYPLPYATPDIFFPVAPELEVSKMQHC
ncbi:hypothetical protein B0H63DRAFT_466126 [Podospora didyma]|uniref:HMG box domain-containing protein n=1 Tax=Podospora didyma TaxID=330526 RepID=A0AAE0P051_9PEZI|nr:hypothetical protein B0H63DRAFT_466126 [Podospora didyma]